MMCNGFFILTVNNKAFECKWDSVISTSQKVGKRAYPPLPLSATGMAVYPALLRDALSIYYDRVALVEIGTKKKLDLKSAWSKLYVLLSTVQRHTGLFTSVKASYFTASLISLNLIHFHSLKNDSLTLGALST